VAKSALSVNPLRVTGASGLTKRSTRRAEPLRPSGRSRCGPANAGHVQVAAEQPHPRNPSLSAPATLGCLGRTVASTRCQRGVAEQWSTTIAVAAVGHAAAVDLAVHPVADPGGAQRARSTLPTVTCPASTPSTMDHERQGLPPAGQAAQRRTTGWARPARRCAPPSCRGRWAPSFQVRNAPGSGCGPGAASNSRGGRSSTTPAATVSAEPRGPAGCDRRRTRRSPRAHPRWARKHTLDLLPDADVGDVLFDHGQAVGSRERRQQVRAGRAQRFSRKSSLPLSRSSCPRRKAPPALGRRQRRQQPRADHAPVRVGLARAVRISGRRTPRTPPAAHRVAGAAGTWARRPARAGRKPCAEPGCMATRVVSRSPSSASVPAPPAHRCPTSRRRQRRHRQQQPACRRIYA